MLRFLFGLLFVLSMLCTLTPDAEARCGRGRLRGFFHRHHQPVRTLLHRVHDRRCCDATEATSEPEQLRVMPVEEPETTIVLAGCGCGSCGFGCDCGCQD